MAHSAGMAFGICGLREVFGSVNLGGYLTFTLTLDQKLCTSGFDYLGGTRTFN